MTSVDLLPELRTLPRMEKLRVVQFLIGELTREEETQPFAAPATFQIWSPFEATEAAVALQAMLEQENREGHV